MQLPAGTTTRVSPPSPGTVITGGPTPATPGTLAPGQPGTMRVPGTDPATPAASQYRPVFSHEMPGLVNSPQNLPNYFEMNGNQPRRNTDGIPVIRSDLAQAAQTDGHAAVRLAVAQAFQQHGDTVFGGATRIGFVEAGIEMVRNQDGTWNIQQWQGMTVNPARAAQIMQQLSSGGLAFNADNVLIAVAAGGPTADYARLGNSDRTLATYTASLSGLSLGRPGGSGSLASYYYGDQRYDLNGTFGQNIRQSFPGINISSGDWGSPFLLPGNILQQGGITALGPGGVTAAPTLGSLTPGGPGTPPVPGTSR